MLKFIDAHGMEPFSAMQRRELKDAPPDEFGVVHKDILFSEKDNKAWCILDAPNKEAIEKHHEKAGIKSDWVYEIESAAS
jgi:hypothetical protein